MRGGDGGEGDIFSFENLYQNYLKCRRNKRNTINALKFEVNAEENLFCLSEELQSRTYRPSRSICFLVERPKLREIIAAEFRDRIVHHVLVEQLERVYEPVFIHDSYACRNEKGIHRAVERVKDFIRQGSSNGRKRLYYTHLDIRNFFMTIDKNILYEMIERKLRKVFYHLPSAPPLKGGKSVNANLPSKGGQFADTVLWLVHLIIFHKPAENCTIKGKKELISRLPVQKSLFNAEEGKGLPIGNLTSQFFANVYLNALDQYMKHTLKCRHYVRYCDDFLILDDSPERLEEIKKRAGAFVEMELHLTLNPKHGATAPVTKGLDFLGYIIRPVYTLARRRVVNNLKARLNCFEKRLVGKETQSQSVGASERKRDNAVNPVIPTCSESLCRGDSGQAGGTKEARLIRYDYPIIEQLRAVVASYWGHLKWADTFRLRTALFHRYAWLKEYLNEDVNMPALTCRFRTEFPSVRSQYRYFAARFNDCAVFFQVGSFYEVYDNEAWAQRISLNRVKESRRGVWYGFPVKLREKFAGVLLAEGRSVVIVEETEDYSGKLKKRLPVMKLSREAFYE